MSETELMPAWDQEMSLVSKSDEMLLRLSGDSNILDRIVNEESSAQALKPSQDGTGVRTHERLDEADGLEIQEREMSMSRSERFDAIIYPDQERMQMNRPPPYHYPQASGSIPTQIATDDPLDHLQTQPFISVAADAFSPDFGEQRTDLQDDTIGTGCFYDRHSVEDTLLNWTEQVQNDLDQMSRAQENIDGYAPISFLLWFSVPRSFSDALSEVKNSDNGLHTADWLVNPWLMVLLACSKVQSLIYGTRLYCRLWKILEIPTKYLSTVDLTGVAMENWYDLTVYKTISLDHCEPHSLRLTAKRNTDPSRVYKNQESLVPEDPEVLDKVEVARVGSLDNLGIVIPAHILTKPLGINTGTGKSTQNASPMRQEVRLEEVKTAQKLDSRINKRVPRECSCRICGEVFGAKIEVDNHIVEQHLPCDFCDRWFKGNAELINHCDAKHQFVCFHALCRRRSFRNQQELSIHLEVMHLDDSGSISAESGACFNAKLTEEPLLPFDLAEPQRQTTKSKLDAEEPREAPASTASVTWN